MRDVPTHSDGGTHSRGDHNDETRNKQSPIELEGIWGSIMVRHGDTTSVEEVSLHEIHAEVKRELQSGSRQ